MSRALDETTEAERESLLESYFAEQRAIGGEKVAAVTSAVPALGRLCECMRARTWQGYKLLAFGHDTFFYRQIEEAVRGMGLADWFREEGS